MASIEGHTIIMMLHDLTLIPGLQFALNWAIIIGLLASLLLEAVYLRQ